LYFPSAFETILYAPWIAANATNFDIPCFLPS
jgi:hypothetical protein